MSDRSHRRWAEAYAALLEQVGRATLCVAAEGDAGAEDTLPLLREMELQSCWQAGLLGSGGETQRHGPVRILDFGTWNRSSGPDFLRAEIELDGRRVRGDIELDPRAQDWENHGHGSNPDYNGVVLHVVLNEVPKGWFTRNSRHEEIPVLSIAPEVCRRALGCPAPLAAASLDLCREPLAALSREHVQTLLQGAALYRMQKKRLLFRRKSGILGERQAWYEAWAETLGYRVNKIPMLMLARRAPLCELGKTPEAVLFGTAGFLVPVLPEKASSEDRQYHRLVWDAWWPLRGRFSLDGPSSIPWNYAPIRPLNHPHRRVAALALSVSHWRKFEPLLSAESASGLTKLLTSLHHPYWSRHCALPSVPLSRDYALVGRDRVRDFLINHVYVQDESDSARMTYLNLRDRQPSSRVQRVAAKLFGGRGDLGDLLQFCYAQQALLQIDADFCCVNRCGECLFPTQLQAWSL